MSEEDQGNYGWWTAFKKLDDLEKSLEKIVPNPQKVRLIDIDKEYTPQELRDLLQHFGSYLSSLYPVESRIMAENHALKEVFNTGLKVALGRAEAPTRTKTTVKDREAEVLAGSDIFKDTKRMQIDGEAQEMLVHGWIKAYESAQFTASRLITLALGEVEHLSGRIP